MFISEIPHCLDDQTFIHDFDEFLNLSLGKLSLMIKQLELPKLNDLDINGIEQAWFELTKECEIKRELIRVKNSAAAVKPNQSISETQLHYKLGHMLS